jgi:hypothetical protein
MRHRRTSIPLVNPHVPINNSIPKEQTIAVKRGCDRAASSDSGFISRGEIDAGIGVARRGDCWGRSRA